MTESLQWPFHKRSMAVACITYITGQGVVVGGTTLPTTATQEPQLYWCVQHEVTYVFMTMHTCTSSYVWGGLEVGGGMCLHKQLFLEWIYPHLIVYILTLGGQFLVDTHRCTFPKCLHTWRQGGPQN